MHSRRSPRWPPLGSKPFVDFVQYQFPRLNSGDAFFWIDMPPAIPINYGIYGLLGRLRLLGIVDTTRETGALVSTAFGAVLFVAALAAGWARTRNGRSSDNEFSRAHEAQVWLALLNLGSFRSPFVPDAYALMGTTWLLTLIAAEWRSMTAERALVFAAAAVMFSLVFDGIWVTDPPRWVVVLTLANQLLAFGLNGLVLVRVVLARIAIVRSARGLPARA